MNNNERFSFFSIWTFIISNCCFSVKVNCGFLQQRQWRTFTEKLGSKNDDSWLVAQIKMFEYLCESYMQLFNKGVIWTSFQLYKLDLFFYRDKSRFNFSVLFCLDLVCWVPALYKHSRLCFRYNSFISIGLFILSLFRIFIARFPIQIEGY